MFILGYEEHVSMVDNTKSVVGPERRLRTDELCKVGEKSFRYVQRTEIVLPKSVGNFFTEYKQ